MRWGMRCILMRKDAAHRRRVLFAARIQKVRESRAVAFLQGRADVRLDGGAASPALPPFGRATMSDFAPIFRYRPKCTRSFCLGTMKAADRDARAEHLAPTAPLVLPRSRTRGT